MAINDKKISKIVSKQFPEFVRSRHPELLTFIEKYYTLMESAVLTLSQKEEVDQIQLETAETSYLQLNSTDEFNTNSGDYIVDEQSLYGEFTSGEIITGTTSGQTATILVDDADNNKLYITANTKFIIGETITGSISNASAKIGEYRGNPIENINQLLEYVDVDNTLDKFFLEFRNQLLNAIPNNLITGLNKRKFTKNISDLYQKKGTTEGHKTFFRALLDENAEIYYPTVDLLRVSDGEWRKRDFIKVTLKSPVDADTNNLLNQTITQTEIIGNDFVNTATAIVNAVEKETINGVEVSTLYLEKNSIVGNFRFSSYDDLLLEDGDSILLETGDKIDQEAEIYLTGVDRTDPEILIQCVIRPSIDEITIIDPGAYYVANDTINFTNEGSGVRGNLQITSVSSGKITGIVIDDGGSGYAVNDVLNVDNTGTGGSDFAGYVSSVSGGVITGITITNYGNGYSVLPSISVTSSGGSGADIFATSDEIGKILQIDVLDHGYNYQAVADVNVHTHLQLKDLSDSFISGETVTSTTTDNIISESYYYNNMITENGDNILFEDDDIMVSDFPFTPEPQFKLLDETDGDEILLEEQTTGTATVDTYIGASHLLELKDITNYFQATETITGLTSGTTATIVNENTASISSTIDTVVTDSGEFINVDGHVSESTKRIQDSLYYQDYSYVVKIGESIRTWRDDAKRSMHPAGFNLFGEVAIRTQVSAKMKKGFTLSSGITEADEVIELFELIFSEKIGRRLGTATDGTSLRSTPNAGIEGSASFGNTRDLTLSTERKITFNSDRQRQVQSINVTRGFVYAGPRYSNINRFASTAFDTTASDSGITLDVLNNIKIRGTGKTPPNESTPTFADFTSDLRTNFTLPTEITTTTSP